MSTSTILLLPSSAMDTLFLLHTVEARSRRKERREGKGGFWMDLGLVPLLIPTLFFPDSVSLPLKFLCGTVGGKWMKMDEWCDEWMLKWWHDEWIILPSCSSFYGCRSRLLQLPTNSSVVLESIASTNSHWDLAMAKQSLKALMVPQWNSFGGPKML